VIRRTDEDTRTEQRCLKGVPLESWVAIPVVFVLPRCHGMMVDASMLIVGYQSGLVHTITSYIIRPGASRPSLLISRPSLGVVQRHNSRASRCSRQAYSRRAETQSTNRRLRAEHAECRGSAALASCLRSPYQWATGLEPYYHLTKALRARGVVTMAGLREQCETRREMVVVSLLGYFCFLAGPWHRAHP
jgi:hypothetical protein